MQSFVSRLDSTVRIERTKYIGQLTYLKQRGRFGGRRPFFAYRHAEAALGQPRMKQSPSGTVKESDALDAALDRLRSELCSRRHTQLRKDMAQVCGHRAPRDE